MSELLKDYIEMATDNDGGIAYEDSTGKEKEIVSYAFIHTASCNTDDVHRIAGELAASGAEVSIGDFCSESIERGLQSGFVTQNGYILATVNGFATLIGREDGLNPIQYAVDLDNSIRSGNGVLRMPNGDMPDDNIIVMAGAVAEWAKLSNPQSAGIVDPMARARDTVDQACAAGVREKIDRVTDNIYIGEEQGAAQASFIGKRIASDAFMDVNSANVVSFPDGEAVVPDRCPAVETASLTSGRGGGASVGGGAAN